MHSYPVNDTYQMKVTLCRNYANGYGIGDKKYGGAGYGYGVGRGLGNGSGYCPDNVMELVTRGGEDLYDAGAHKLVLPPEVMMVEAHE